jgi:site-specific DNA recombinase
METERYIALYCRVSTDEQAREGISLEEQQTRLTAYCRAMGWNDQYKLYIDDGYSAKSLERPKLHQLLDDVKKGVIAKVLVTKLDRLSRRLLDLLELIDLFQEFEVTFTSVSESFDTNTPSGRLTLQILGAVAEFERERIRERVFDNMFHAAQQGKWLTQSPYGYQLQDKELVIDETEAEVVRRIVRMYLDEGRGFHAIAKLLNEEGIPSRFGKEWSLRSVKLLLSNPVYKGTYVWNRTDSSKKTRKEKNPEDWVVIDDCLPKIIDKITWERIQYKMKHNPRAIAPRAQTSPHLLGGLLQCGRCGSGMSIGYSGSKNRRYRVYRCSANKNKGTCTSKQYRAKEMEEAFKKGLLQLSTSIGINVLPKLSFKDLDHSEIDVGKKIQNAKSRYQRKVEAYTAGLISLDDLRLEKEEMNRILQETAEMKKSTQPMDTQALEAKLRETIRSILDAIDMIPIDEMKILLQQIIHKVVVKDEDGIEIQLKKPK